MCNLINNHEFPDQDTANSIIEDQDSVNSIIDRDQDTVKSIIEISALISPAILRFKF